MFTNNTKLKEQFSKRKVLILVSSINVDERRDPKVVHKRHKSGSSRNSAAKKNKNWEQEVVRKCRTRKKELKKEPPTSSEEKDKREAFILPINRSEEEKWRQNHSCFRIKQSSFKIPLSNSKHYHNVTMISIFWVLYPKKEHPQSHVSTMSSSLGGSTRTCWDCWLIYFTIVS